MISRQPITIERTIFCDVMYIYDMMLMRFLSFTAYLTGKVISIYCKFPLFFPIMSASFRRTTLPKWIIFTQSFNRKKQRSTFVPAEAAVFCFLRSKVVTTPLAWFSNHSDTSSPTVSSRTSLRTKFLINSICSKRFIASFANNCMRLIGFSALLRAKSRMCFWGKFKTALGTSLRKHSVYPYANIRWSKRAGGWICPTFRGSVYPAMYRYYSRKTETFLASCFLFSKSSVH